MPTKRRRYSDNDKATALAMYDANGGNLYRTSRELKIPQSTLEEWVNGRGTSHDVPELRNEKRQELQEVLRDLAYEIAGAMPAKIKSATLSQQSTALGIVLEKMQLLSGKATERVDVTDWRSEAIDYIKAGKVDYQELTKRLGTDLATELFRQAGVEVVQSAD